MKLTLALITLTLMGCTSMSGQDQYGNKFSYTSTRELRNLELEKGDLKLKVGGAGGLVDVTSDITDIVK